MSNEENAVPPAPCENFIKAMDADPALQTFIRSFLIPIAADGKLEAVEETPLSCAFAAFSVCKYGTDDQVAGYLTHAILEAREKAADKCTPGEQRKALAELLRCSGGITVNDAQTVIKWMQDLWTVVPVEEARRTLADMASVGHWGLAEEGITDAVMATLELGTCDLNKGLFAANEPDRTVHKKFLELVRKLLVQIEAKQPVEIVKKESAEVAKTEPVTPAPAESTPTIATAPLQAAPLQPTRVLPALQEFKCVEDNCTQEDLAPFAEPASVTNHLLQRTDEIANWVDDCLAGKVPWEFAFSAECQQPQVLMMQKAEDVPPNLWFVGDVHGDSLALEMALGYIDRVSKQLDQTSPTVVFLGDLFDRMRYGYAVVLRVLTLAKDRPGKVLWLAGNHDEALKYNGSGSSFCAAVNPAEFADWLNGRPQDDLVAKRIGKGLAALGALLPRAIFLPDGLLAAHGGVPHTDRLADIKSAEDLNDARCLQDFVWTRLHPRARQRVPNRNSKTCDLGFLDFEAFCDRMKDLFPQPIRCMVRGHDHVEKRFDPYVNYKKNRVLTINTFSCRQDGEWLDQFATPPCVARHRPGELPEVHRLIIPEELVKKYHA